MWCSSRQQPTPRHVAISWARRLKRVFGIEIEGCARCGGRLKVIASIEEPEVIAKILSHLEKTAPDRYQAELPLGARALPSQASLTNSARQGRDGAFELTIPGTSTKRPPDRRIAVLRIQSPWACLEFPDLNEQYSCGHGEHGLELVGRPIADARV